MISIEKKGGSMATRIEGDGDDVMEETFWMLALVIAKCEQAIPGSRRKVPRMMARWLRSREFQDDVDTMMKREARADADNAQ